MAPNIDRTSYRSPNHSSRNGAAIGLLVLHSTVGDALSSLQHLCNPAPTNTVTGKPDPKLAVSTHYLITRKGKGYQLVDESEAAWHAGASRWRDWGSVQIRDGSIGIELENKNDGRDPYPQAQLDALTALIQDIFTRHPNLSIVSHAQIAIPAGRKTDPKGFDFGALNQALAQSTPPPPITKRYRVKHRYVTQRKEDNGPPVVRELIPGEELVVDAWYVNGRVHLASGEGFADLVDLEPV